MCNLLRSTLFALALSAWLIRAEIFVEETLCGHVPYAEVAVYVAQRYMSPKTNTLVIKEKCTRCHREKQNVHLRMLDHFLIHFDGSMTLQLFFGTPNERPWDYNVFIVDSSLAFDMLRFKIPKTKHDREFHFLIILTIFPAKERLLTFHMLAIFKSCLQFNVHNVVIMSRVDDGSFRFYSHSLYGPNHCSQVLKVYECNRFRNGRLENDFLFPPRLVDFHNCSLRVCAHALYPMLAFHGDRKNASDRRVENLFGIEGEMLKRLAKTMNFHVKLSMPEGTHMIGEYMNSTGCFAELQANKADMAIGGFTRAQPLCYIFSVSLSYHQSPFVFVVRSDLHFGPMKQLANAYTCWVWMLIALSVVVATIAIHLIRVLVVSRMPRNRFARFSTITNLVTILMGNPVRCIPHCNATRLLLAAWMLAALVLRNAYQGKLFDTLRAARRVPTPRSIDEMIQQGYVLYSAGYVTFYPSNLTVLLPSISKRYGVVQQSSQRYATFSMLDSLAAYNDHHWNTSRLTFVDEPIFRSQLAIYFKKHSMLRAIFDHRLTQLITAGVPARILQQHIKPRFELLKSRSVSVSVPRIGSNMLRGLYSVYAMFVGLAATVFVLELMSRRYATIKRMLDRLHNIQ